MFNSLLEVTRYAALFSGARFFPAMPFGMPAISKIELDDIAHALSNICRFNGHCREFYSVAQHCVLVADLVDSDRLRFAALLHDASEAYIGDLVTPFKRMFEALVRLEVRVQTEVNQHFGISLSEADEASIKRADRKALSTEKRDLMARQRWEQWSYLGGYEPSSQVIVPLPPKEAKALFLDRFETYSYLPYRRAA